MNEVLQWNTLLSIIAFLRCENPRIDFLISKANLGGGFKYVLFLPLLGEDSHFD